MTMVRLSVLTRSFWSTEYPDGPAYHRSWLSLSYIVLWRDGLEGQQCFCIKLHEVLDLYSEHLSAHSWFEENIVYLIRSFD